MPDDATLRNCLVEALKHIKADEKVKDYLTAFRILERKLRPDDELASCWHEAIREIERRHAKELDDILRSYGRKP